MPNYISDLTSMPSFRLAAMKSIGLELCSYHMAPAKPAVCHRVVNFVRTVEHGEGTRRGVERSVNTLVAR